MCLFIWRAAMDLASPHSSVCCLTEELTNYHPFLCQSQSSTSTSFCFRLYYLTTTATASLQCLQHTLPPTQKQPWKQCKIPTKYTTSFNTTRAICTKAELGWEGERPIHTLMQQQKEHKYEEIHHKSPNKQKPERNQAR
jgi:hypothetical protein